MPDPHLRFSAGTQRLVRNLNAVDFFNPQQCERFIKEQFGAGSTRLQHILVIADRVRQSARDLAEMGTVGGIDEVTAYCAALVHDIGYLEPLHRTGFHPVDGADYLRSNGCGRLADLIVGHSSSPEEAVLRNIADVAPSDDPIAQLLSYWDMQVGPGGEVMAYEERLADILRRHGEHSIVGKANLTAAPRIRALIAQVDRWLQRSPS